MRVDLSRQFSEIEEQAARLGAMHGNRLLMVDDAHAFDSIGLGELCHRLQDLAKRHGIPILVFSSIAAGDAETEALNTPADVAFLLERKGKNGTLQIVRNPGAQGGETHLLFVRGKLKFFELSRWKEIVG